MNELTYGALIVFGTAVLTNLLKKYVYPKYRSNGVHVVTFILAAIGVGIYLYAGTNPSFGEFIKESLKYMMITIGIYEVILRKLPVGFDSSKEKLAKSAKSVESEYE